MALIYHLAPGRDGRARFDEGELREPFRDYGLLASRVLEGLRVDPAELFVEE